jgi:hypothetical protein
MVAHKTIRVGNRIVPFNQEHRVSNGEEPQYVDDPFETDRADRRPKWMIPQTPFQKDFLSVCGRKYYKDHKEHTAVVMIEKAALSLEAGVTSRYPTEWIEVCMEWVQVKRKKGFPIVLAALISLVNNEERKQEWLARYARKHGPIGVPEDGRPTEDLH